MGNEVAELAVRDVAAFATRQGGPVSNNRKINNIRADLVMWLPMLLGQAALLARCHNTLRALIGHAQGKRICRKLFRVDGAMSSAAGRRSDPQGCACAKSPGKVALARYRGFRV